MRQLLKKRGCPICISYLGVIQRVNVRLPVEKRIQIVDTSDYEEHDVNLSPIVNHLKWEGTPTLFLDGIKVVGMTTPWYVEGFLTGYFEERGEFLY